MLVGKSINIDSNVNAFYGVHGRAVIARMVDVNALKNIKVTVSEICPFLEKNQYLGGLDVRITFDIPENAAVFRDVVVLVVDKFSMVSIWEGQAFGFERLAWLKVQGIPLRLLTNEVIDEVGSLFGKVVHHADRSESDLDLSYEYVGILLGDGKRVSEEIVLNWKDRKFRVWVMEELGEWIPDFLEINSPHNCENKQDGSGHVSDGSMSEEDCNSSDNDLENDDENVNVENNHCDTEDLNDNNVSIEAENTERFVPAVSFQFEQVIEGNVSIQSVENKVTKRKKFKKGSEVERPSNSYSSSQESLKIVKRPKRSDPFELNGLLGLEDEGDLDASGEEINETKEIGEVFDLNVHPKSTN
ncbi:hypothetical protein HanIR_Chr06g0265081 [Helianthus annuus]|nr:hypothetical protein HanIR_Chr06g0265081 [Helianthus annuus]KAJ0572594.1 hypothetical protein HanHA89_Chr06g0217441 [Helianthus annuus]KAJ0737043.1 hypothetical protein HanLR1_Chr06g0202571 [Helianthus annuus]